jgi:hypothetical protein
LELVYVNYEPTKSQDPFITWFWEFLKLLLANAKNFNCLNVLFATNHKMYYKHECGASCQRSK